MAVTTAERLRSISQVANTLAEKRMELNRRMHHHAMNGNTSVEFDVHNMTSEDRMALRDELIAAGLTGQMACKDGMWIIRWA